MTILLIVNLDIILLIGPIPTLLFKIINPETFNDDVHVKVLFIIVVPDTYNDLFIVVLFDNVVKPDIFNDDVHVALLCSVVVPDTYHELFIVVLFDNVVKPDIFNDDNTVDAPETNKLVKLVLLNNAVDVAFKLSIFNLLYVDNEFELLKIVVINQNNIDI